MTDIQKSEFTSIGFLGQSGFDNKLTYFDPYMGKCFADASFKSLGQLTILGKLYKIKAIIFNTILVCFYIYTDNTF